MSHAALTNLPRILLSPSLNLLPQLPSTPPSTASFPIPFTISPSPSLSLSHLLSHLFPDPLPPLPTSPTPPPFPISPLQSFHFRGRIFFTTSFHGEGTKKKGRMTKNERVNKEWRSKRDMRDDKKRFLKEFFFTGRESEGGKCEEETTSPQSLKSSSPPPQELPAKKTIYLLVREKVIFSTGV